MILTIKIYDARIPHFGLMFLVPLGFILQQQKTHSRLNLKFRIEIQNATLFLGFLFFLDIQSSLSEIIQLLYVQMAVLSSFLRMLQYLGCITLLINLKQFLPQKHLTCFDDDRKQFFVTFCQHLFGKCPPFNFDKSIEESG